MENVYFRDQVVYSQQNREMMQENQSQKLKEWKHRLSAGKQNPQSKSTKTFSAKNILGKKSELWRENAGICGRF